MSIGEEIKNHNGAGFYFRCGTTTQTSAAAENPYGYKDDGEER